MREREMMEKMKHEMELKLNPGLCLCVFTIHASIYYRIFWRVFNVLNACDQSIINTVF